MEPTSEETRQRMVRNSWALVVESKRLLLCLLERRQAIEHGPAYARSIEDLREELELAEHMCRANRAPAYSVISTKQLDDTYLRLIDRATTCAARLASSAPLLQPEDRFNTAVKVQTLDELIDKWRAAAGG
jgi:hypothetical protein